jgi:chorismate mutase
VTELDRLRAELDDVDARILAAIAARFDVIRKIARHKQDHNLPMMQHDRVSFVRGRYEAYGIANGLQADTLASIATQLIKAACQLEDELMVVEPAESSLQSLEPRA